MVIAIPDEPDVAIGTHIAAIRDRFGIDGMREAAHLIAIEIAIFDDAADQLRAD